MLDGDGLFLVTRSPQLLQRAGDAGGAAAPARVVLTPNVNELKRLRDALGVPAPAGAPAGTAWSAQPRR